MKKKLIAALLTLVMIVSLLPTVALADGGKVATINDLQEGVSFAYDATAATAPVVIDGGGVSVEQWADAWVHQDTTIKNVTFENGASFNVAANDITLTLENCTFKACDQSKITVTHKVNSGAGMCLNVEKSDKTGVSFVIRNCTFVGDGGADVDRAGNKYAADGTIEATNKARGHAIALDAICGGGTGTLESLTIEGCEITNTRGNAIQLYGTTGNISIKDTKIHSWGQNNAMDKDDAAIRGDFTEGGARTLTLSNIEFGLPENDTDSGKKLYHVNVGSYSGNTDRTQAAGTYFVPVVVAEVNGLSYATVQAAVNAAGNGDTVKIIKDIEVSLSDMDSQDISSGGKIWKYRTWVRIAKDMTLDFNGHTISIAESAKSVDTSTNPHLFRLFVLQMGANVTVTGNGKIVGNGGNAEVKTFNISKSKSTTSTAKTHLTVENGEFSTYSGTEIIHAYAETTCTINGGTFRYVGDGNGTTALNCQGSTNFAFSITGGTYNFDPRNMNDGNLVADGCCVKSHDDGTYTVAVCGESWVSEVTTQPTYTEEGERTYYCANCGKVMDTEPIEKRDPLPVIGALSSVIEDDVDFVDVSPRDYFYKAVAWAVRNDITTGTSRRYFSPDDACTRAQAVTFLWRAAGEPRANGTNPFSDVSVSDYYYEAVLWAVSEGIVKGTSDTTFSPNATCTRAQIVTMLYRAAGEPVGYVNAGFTDVASGAYYAEAVAWAVVEGITDGTSTTTFSPDATCTRAQIVTFLYRS